MNLFQSTNSKMGLDKSKHHEKKSVNWGFASPRSHASVCWLVGLSARLVGLSVGRSVCNNFLQWQESYTSNTHHMLKIFPKAGCWKLTHKIVWYHIARMDDNAILSAK